MMNTNASIGSSPAVGILDVIPAHKFPDIWEKIFLNLSRLDDLRNAGQTSREWNEILQSTHKRSTRMFQSFPKAFPFLSRYLGKLDILTLRKVCGAWSQGVDEFIEGAGRPTPYKEEERERNASLWIAPTSTWNPLSMYGYYLPYVIGGNPGSLDVDAFLESLGDHSRNPFIGRQLQIDRFNRHSSLEEVQDGIDKLLPRLGHHLTYVVMRVQGESVTPHQFAGMVQTVLSNIPNLKQFSLVVPSHFENSSAQDITVPVLTQLQTLQLRCAMSRRSKPAQVLNLFRNLIRNHAPQLRRLDVIGVDDPLWTTSMLSWPKLTELRLEVDARRGVAFSSLFNMDAPHLSRLFIRLEGTYYLSELVRLVEHFPSLKFNNIVINAPQVGFY